MPRSSVAFGFPNATAREGLTCSRRNLLKASLAGFDGLTLPTLTDATNRTLNLLPSGGEPIKELF